MLLLRILLDLPSGCFPRILPIRVVFTVFVAPQFGILDFVIKPVSAAHSGCTVQGVYHLLPVENVSTDSNPTRDMVVCDLGMCKPCSGPISRLRSRATVRSMIEET
jgi:hypothetical protein